MPGKSSNSAVRTVTDFKIGDWVEWESQAHGYSRTKTGCVVAVLRSWERVPDEFASELPGHGNPRTGISYIVRVPAKTNKGRGKLYWPITNRLTKAALLPDVVSVQ